jgi:hypothetical protein
MLSDGDLLETIKRYPSLRNRIEELTTIIENPAGETDLADVAEERIIESFRGFGQELLQDWAENRMKKANLQLEKCIPSAHKNKKKDFIGTQRLGK